MMSHLIETNAIDEFWQAMELSDSERDIKHYLLFKLIHQIRETLPDENSIAQAIDNKEPWKEIALQAEENGYKDFAETLRFADRLLVHS